MSNWQLMNEFTLNPSNPQQGDPVVRVNKLTKWDGTNIYSVQVGSVGPDFPSRLGLFIQPEPLTNGSLRKLILSAEESIALAQNDDMKEAMARIAKRLVEKEEKEKKAKAKRQRRESNLAARKAENQARAHGGGNKKK